MGDLEQFGKALRELREGRGITQEEAVSRSETYSEASGLRKIERGAQKPKRHVIITLLMKGFEENDPAKIDELLVLAGYQPLTDSERLKMGFPVLPAEVDNKGLPCRDSLRPSLLRLWNVLICACLIAAL